MSSLELFGNKSYKLLTPVIYNQDKIGKIHSVGTGENVIIKLYEDNSLLDVKKTHLKILPYDKGELVVYNDKYYLIYNIKVCNLQPVYELNFVNKKTPEYVSIDHINDISSVDKKEQGKLISYLKFKDRYNQTVSYLNKKAHAKFVVLNDDINSVGKQMGMLFSRCKLTMSQLNNIEHTLKKHQNKKLEIDNLVVEPFNFITEDYQILSYDRCEKICEEFGLDVDFEIKIEKWSYDLFLREKKAMYLPKWLYESELKKFCEKREHNFRQYLTHINKIIIDKVINKEVYKTTNHLIDFERKTTDLAMDLYYDKQYDISKDHIYEIICYYEELKRRTDKDKDFMLENKQKIGVVNSILNKLSIVTGPPGTGKTEILLCINYVLYFLFVNEIIKKYENDRGVICDNEFKKYLCNIVYVERATNEDTIVGKNEVNIVHKIVRTTLPDENDVRKTTNTWVTLPYYKDITKYLRDNIDNENSPEYSDFDTDDDDDGNGVASLDFYNRHTNECMPCATTINEYENTYISPKTIGLIAPTGLAYVNMERKQQIGHYNSKISGTCHRILYNIVPNIVKHSKECNCKTECPYKCTIKLLEIDEVSMLDIFMFYDVLKECRMFNARLILLGDVDQLPSIGPGKVLYQLINSNVFDVTNLQKIKRQSDGCLVNTITKMSTQIVTKYDMTDNTMAFKDIDEFVSYGTINKDAIIKLIQEHNLTKLTTKFICGFNKQKFIFNTQDLNIILQNIFNPLKDHFEFDLIRRTCKYENGFNFRVQDKIIRTENDYSSTKMRANGEEAEIISYDGANTVEILYSGNSEVNERIRVDELYENFALNYCVTVHKSQGSQYTNVVFIIEPKNTLIKKKSLYTSISRAREKCILISNETDLINAQNMKEKMDLKMSLLMKESDNYEL